MNRERFDHVVRAAAGVLGESELLLIGSQAEHASVSEPLPEEAERSVEVDIVPLDDPDGSKADRVDGSIGEASMFHESLGVYARGAGETTAVVPDGWRDRLVRYTEPASGVVAWCLELHDLWVAKAIAGRPKDREFCDALLDAGLVDAVTLRARVEETSRASDVQATRAPAWIDRPHNPKVVGQAASPAEAGTDQGRLSLSGGTPWTPTTPGRRSAAALERS